MKLTKINKDFGGNKWAIEDENCEIITRLKFWYLINSIKNFVYNNKFEILKLWEKL